ncbi:hypothetical protein [Microbacterium sp. No. 7]|uniref:hypothetical protein n=1 Tax=Microbacterium sp. No. 7 TaxID=1714373 RepID=UPI0006D0106F|nr:hypothetical protein [Microbacterium sp. No. 7]ALJ19555.1 hypothetical protein AOA12_06380 [Microbacterium sp. No. 7]
MATDIPDLLAEARGRLTVSRMGRSMWRETDADLIVIRKLINALKSEHQRAEKLRALSVHWQSVVSAPDFAKAVEEEVRRYHDVACSFQRERDALRGAIQKALTFEAMLPAIATEPRRILTEALNPKNPGNPKEDW